MCWIQFMSGIYRSLQCSRKWQTKHQKTVYSKSAQIRSARTHWHRQGAIAQALYNEHCVAGNFIYLRYYSIVHRKLRSSRWTITSDMHRAMLFATMLIMHIPSIATPRLPHLSLPVPIQYEVHCAHCCTLHAQEDKTGVVYSQIYTREQRLAVKTYALRCIHNSRWNM